VKKESRHRNARDYASGLAAKGRYHFTSREVRSALRISADAGKLALNRLEKKSFIASPARGFYVLVPPEYRSLGCLPADQFIPALMKRLGLPYYAGLLSAAQYHGAAHQRPQEFQVFLAKNRRPIRCGMVRVAFIARKHIKDVPVQSFNTPRGTVLVSSPEATALDLVGYAGHAGGLGQVATVLSELGERLDGEKLATAARTAPVPWAQRLGYLLEHLGFDSKTAPLKEYVRKHSKQWILLLPKAPDKRSHRNKGWKLNVNTKVEAELGRPAIGGLRAEKAVCDFWCGDGGAMQSKQRNSSAEGMQPETRTLWARTTLRVAPAKYCLVSLPTTMLSEAVRMVAKEDRRFAALIAEPDEVSLTIRDSVWETSSLRRRATAQSGPFRVITFNLDLNPAVVGYLAPAAHRLAEAGISIVPQCAFSKDHLLIQEADLPKATEVLKKLISDCKKPRQPQSGAGPGSST